MKKSQRLLLTEVMVKVFIDSADTHSQIMNSFGVPVGKIRKITLDAAADAILNMLMNIILKDEKNEDEAFEMVTSLLNKEELSRRIKKFRSNAETNGIDVGKLLKILSLKK